MQPRSPGWIALRTRGAPSTSPSELLSFAERSRYLGVLRLAMATVVVLAYLTHPEMLAASPGTLLLATAGYLAASAIVAALGAPAGRTKRVARPVLQGGLLLDGIYLVATIAVTGGAESPLRFLLAAHVVAVTLLCSYRTGFKIALWHSLLFLLALQAIGSGLLLDVPPGSASDAAATALAVAALWVVALCTAAFSAASERELRRQRLDLACLSAMVATIEERPTAATIPQILLDELCATFGFLRGVVLVAPEGELRMAASTEASDPASGLRPGLDPLVTGVRHERAPRLVRKLDDATDLGLSALMPEARNVVIVPMLLEGGRCLGVVALERGGSSRGVRRWILSMVQQFVAHAALALRNAWLTEERDAQLETIQALEHALRVHNAELETRVTERTAELRETVAILRDTDEQRRRLLAHVVHVAEEERRRVANDIHDDPVQKMITLKMRLEMLAKAHPELAEMEQSKDAVMLAIHSLRHLLFDLRPPVLDEGNLGEALHYLLENAELPFPWSLDDQLSDESSEQTCLILYRIAQEAVANARKHSKANHLSVLLRDADGGVWMEVTDDGQGFRPQEAVLAAPGHLGLAAIRERAEMAGGSCVLRSLPGAGTTVEVWMPSHEGEGSGAVPDDGIRHVDARAS